MRSRGDAGADRDHPAARPVRHAFTVDVEDWYQGIDLGGRTTGTLERRLSYSLDLLLELLAQHGVRGTFFWLGLAAADHPRLVRQVADAGHEIGCHGWSHDPIYTMTPQRFRDEIGRALALLADLAGGPVSAYRAAFFSITRRSLWALEILAALGFRYDSSIFPVRNWRYGIPDFYPWPQQLDTPAGPIYELPISVRRVIGRTIPVSGGAYFRIYPYALTRSNLRALERAGRPAIFYIHPWELDCDHPRLSFYWKARLTHYANLRSAGAKLRRLLREFAFVPLSEIDLRTSVAAGAGSLYEPGEQRGWA